MPSSPTRASSSLAMQDLRLVEFFAGVSLVLFIDKKPLRANVLGRLQSSMAPAVQESDPMLHNTQALAALQSVRTRALDPSAKKRPE